VIAGQYDMLRKGPAAAEVFDPIARTWVSEKAAEHVWKRSGHAVVELTDALTGRTTYISWAKQFPSLAAVERQLAKQVVPRGHPVYKRGDACFDNVREKLWRQYAEWDAWPRHGAPGSSARSRIASTGRSNEGPGPSWSTTSVGIKRLLATASCDPTAC